MCFASIRPGEDTRYNRAMNNLLLISRSIGVAAVVLGASACSDPPVTNGTPTDLSSTGKARLVDYCAKNDACAAEQGVTARMCPISTCLAPAVEEPALVEFFDCQIAKACSSFFSDDDCIASAGALDAEREAFIARCLAKTTECGDDFGDACGFGAPLVRKEWMRMADACLGRPCAEVEACVAAIPLVDCWG
jgi:hypothetical protein